MIKEASGEEEGMINRKKSRYKDRNEEEGKTDK